MEFLGDSILGSIIASYIYERFYKIYNENEGFLTKLKIRIVCGENLARLSKSLKLSKHIVLSKHIEDNCSGRENVNILEDVFEALIGAIYLDNDYSTIEKVLIRIIEKYVDFTEVMLKDTNYKDQISRYFQQTFHIYPKYITTKEENTNIFYSKLIHEENIIVTGSGNSKKKAEQDASRKALVHFNVIT
jgi:ribonuclease-3